MSSKVPIHSVAKYAVDELVSGVDFKKVSQNIAAYLMESRQTRLLPQVMRAVEMEFEKRGTSQVEIVSAHSVSVEVQQQLASLLGAKNPVIVTTIDPSVVGGVKARSGEMEIDLTVRGRLQAFKSKLTRVQ